MDVVKCLASESVGVLGENVQDIVMCYTYEATGQTLTHLTK